jgi:hypothetical protein
MRKKSVSVSLVLSTAPFNVVFTRSLVGANLQAWYNVVAMVATVQLANQRDRFVWGLHQNGVFSVNV